MTFLYTATCCSILLLLLFMRCLKYSLAANGHCIALHLCRSFRVELVDEDAESVAPLLNGYRDLLRGELSASKLWQRLQRIPDANGRVHGCSEGSLAPKAEVAWSGMKKTAAAQRLSRSRQS